MGGNYLETVPIPQASERLAPVSGHRVRTGSTHASEMGRTVLAMDWTEEASTDIEVELLDEPGLAKISTPRFIQTKVAMS